VNQTPEAEVSTISDGTMPCPVPSPDGLPCTKTIPDGWTPEEGHGGGHFWMSPEGAAVLDSGHYDVVALISGRPAEHHDPEDCHPGCPRWRGRR